MNRSPLKLIVACGAVCFIVCIAPQKVKTKEQSKCMARLKMKRFPEPWMIEKTKVPRWGYTHGLVVRSILEEWRHTGDSTYYEYAKIYADSLIDTDGHVKTMKYFSFNIDNIDSGRIPFDFYAQSGNERYKTAVDTLRKQMAGQPHTSEGGFWHKLKHLHQMWLDGVFMAPPYLVQYGSTSQEPALYDKVVKQILLIARKTYNPTTGLYYHGWDEDREQKWANPETGCPPSFWSRSIGWYGTALVDILDYLPQETTRRDGAMQTLRRLAETLVRYQDPQSSIWYQVTDQGARERNYLEPSTTALSTYTFVKTVNKGYIGKKYIQPTHKAFDGMVKTFTRLGEDGSYTITSYYVVAGLGGDSKRYRDGSFEYYISEPTIKNDSKSVGSFTLATIEYEKVTDK